MIYYIQSRENFEEFYTEYRELYKGWIFYKIVTM